MLATVLVGCSPPPQNVAENAFDWAVAISDLDDAVLSVCAGDDRIVAVGGAAGQATALEWHDGAWHGAVMPIGSELLWWCWIDEDDTAYAVGDMGTLLRSPSRASWQQVDLAGAVPSDMTLYGIWGSSGSDIIVVGGAFRPEGEVSIMARFDGARWSRIASSPPVQQVLFKVWGASANDVWVVGTGGTLLHWHEQAWTHAVSPTTERLIAVWGTSPQDVYAVGGNASGIVLRYDGTTWRNFDTAGERLSGVWTAPGVPLYVAGDRGFVSRYGRGPTGPAQVTKRTTTLALPSVDLHSITSAGDVIIASGSDLVGGSNAGWRGAVVTHRGNLTGAVVPPPYPDAGPVDAAPPVDAPVGDATRSDATPVDAASPDATPLPGPGEPCGEAPNFCAEGLSCWLLFTSNKAICTESCVDFSRCQSPGYQPSPCCVAPGPQTLETVCVPGNYGECGA